MCALTHGAPPSDKHDAAHSCGRGDRGCISPRHLFWKTQSENQSYQIKQGRKFYGRQGKITFAQAAEIRAIGHSRLLKEIAAQYGISPQRVSGILGGHGFTRPVKPWALRDGRYYPRIVFKGRCYSLGGFKTSLQATATYHAALDRLRRGEPAPAESQTKPDKSDIRSLYTPHIVRFGENQGERVISTEPEQERSSFQLYDALDRLHPRVKEFVIAAINTGEISSAAEIAGLGAAEIALLLPRLKLFLNPYLH